MPHTKSPRKASPAIRAKEGKWFALLREHFDKLLILFLIFMIKLFRALNPNAPPVLSNEQTGMILGTLLGMVAVRKGKQ